MKINFTTILGPIKPLHGVCNSPVVYGDEIPSFKEAGIPYVRLHDTGGAYGGFRFVDIPNIFRDFNADENNPASYDFAFTDAYLTSLHKSGCDIIYRLGVTIENQFRIKAYRIDPPADFAKWARICANIIRHYNDGWANGLHLNITYWEIWNEPENPPMWTGTREQYFELYRVAANYLKQQFPNIKVGGYAGCGFYAINRPNMSDFFKGFITWFDEFLKFCKNPATSAPLDFYSWHLYTADPDEIILHADYVRKQLDTAGFCDTISVFDEWNRIDGSANQFDLMKEMPGATFVAEAFCKMQNGPIDIANYYDALPTRSYGGLFYFPSQKPSKTYYPFKAFNELYKLGKQVVVENDTPHVHAIAATDGDSHHAVFMVNTSDTQALIKLETNNVTFSQLTLLDETHLYLPTPECLQNDIVQLPAKAVALLQ